MSNLHEPGHNRPIATRFKLKRLATTFGAEVDLATLSPSERKEFLSAIGTCVRETKVLVVRNANLDRAEFYALAKSIGTPIKYAFSDGDGKYPELIEIHRKPDQKTALSTMWHSDSTYLEAPPDATLLYGVEVPPYGGATVFADTVSAFGALSPTMRELLRSLRVVQRSDTHAVNERLAHLSRPSDVRSPLSATHPAVFVSDGQESIYVSQEHTAHFAGMTRAESLPLIEFLRRHIEQDQFQLTVNWTAGALVIHDNRKTTHRACDNYYGHSRTLLRLIVRFEDQVSSRGSSLTTSATL